MYEEMYHLLFNAIDDALEQMERLNFGVAKNVLCIAQRRTEDIYIEEEDLFDGPTLKALLASGLLD